MAQRQRKGTPASSGGGQGIFYIVLGVIALVGVAAILYAVRGAGGGTAATEPVELNITDVRQLYETAVPNKIGDDDAPIKVVMFDDLQCPACAAFARTQRPRFMPWVERGEAQLVLYDFPLGGGFAHSFLAARSARCAGEQPLAGSHDGTAYWAYRDRLYQEQGTWSPQRTVTDTYLGYARDLGLDARAFEQCVRSDRYADVVTANRMVGDQLGVSSTPTILVNNRRISARTLDAMGDQVVQILRSAESGAPTAVQ